MYNALAQDDTGPATNSLIKHKPKEMERPWFMYTCNNLVVIPLLLYKRYYTLLLLTSQIAKFIGPKWRPPRSSRPQMGPMLAPWTLLSWLTSQTPKLMGPTWGPPGSCRPQLGPTLALWSLLSGLISTEYVDHHIGNVADDYSDLTIPSKVAEYALFGGVGGRKVQRLWWNSQRTPWWRHQMEIFSALLVLGAGNSPSPMNSPHKGQWHIALVFSLICARINRWVNNREAGDVRHHRAHCDVNVMHETQASPCCTSERNGLQLKETKQLPLMSLCLIRWSGKLKFVFCVSSLYPLPLCTYV